MTASTLSRWQRFRAFTRRKVHDYPHNIPPRTVIKASGLLMLGPALLMISLVFNGYIDIVVALWSGVFLFCLSLLFIFPYIINLTALTDYVRRLADDADAEAPNLKFLSSIQALQGAVDSLHDKWQRRGKQLKSTLEESRVLINSLPDIIIMLDKNYKLVRTNNTAKHVFGRTEYRTTVEAVINDDHIKQAATTALETEQSTAVNYHLDTAQQHYIARIEPFPSESSSKIRLLIVLHNITEQKQTEHMLTDFVANASHEIRTPLTSVQGYIETLQTTAKDDPEATVRFLETMSAQANRMTDLVDDLLSLSRIEKMMNSELTETVAITPIILSAINQLSALAKDANITLNFSTEKKRLPRIVGDSKQLTQVMENLISNAIKYSPKKSAIHITTESSNDHLHIHISDSGIGIPPEDIPRLTERFYRVDKARSRKIGGNGLGLSIVAQIIQRHHGALTIESTEGDGSTFTVSLPIKVATTAKPS